MSSDRVRKQIHDSLDAAYREAIELTPDPGQRVIVFSDQHKGAGDGADDFQRCERSYNAALTYYNHLEYRLVLLGDAEELWENTFEEVGKTYPETLALEAKFTEGDRYTRVWGNHDLIWKKRKRFSEALEPHGVGHVEPVEAVRLLAPGAKGDEKRYELFLAHGHQGTDESDRRAGLSSFFVRHGWRRLQAVLNRPWNTPAVDWRLRGQHAEHMAEWACRRNTVLIAGHTHQPVFFESEDAPASAGGAGAGVGEDVEAKALAAAAAAWLEADARRLGRQKPLKLPAPCYFNTGCCSFGDGDVTGIEIGDGRISLVRWAGKPGPSPEKLAPPLDLADVLDAVATASRATT